MDILKTITEKLKGKITEASFEGANIILYTNNEKFFKEGEGEIKKIVNEIKKRIELRADKEILLDQEKTESKIKKITPEEAEITNIIFDNHRSIVIVEAKKPGMVIGKQGLIINEIKKLMSENSLLFIDVPNDYSAFQNYLVENGYTKNTWFCPPQHLHYFQFESLKSFLESQVLEIVSMQAGFPIEQFLLSKHSNYFHNKDVGKEAHLTRCKVSNFLLSQDVDAYITLRESYANLSFGRNIIMIVKLRLK